MDEIPMIRRKGSRRLEPIDQMSADYMENIPADQIVLVVVKARRNAKQHRLAWALAKKIADGTGFFHGDARECMDWLLMKCRHAKTVVDPRTGEVSLVPKSIAFGALDQLKFDRLLKRMIFVICEEILPDMPEGRLREQIEKMIEGNPQPYYSGAPTHDR